MSSQLYLCQKTVSHSACFNLLALSFQVPFGLQVTQMHAAALAEDASVFDYDGVYDSIQEGRVQPKQQEKLARKSRYIEGLLDKAKERQREQDIIYERT